MSLATIQPVTAAADVSVGNPVLNIGVFAGFVIVTIVIVIKVAGGKNEKITVRSTVHGPILSDAVPTVADAGQEVVEVEGSATGYDIVFDLGDATADGGDFEASWRVVSSDGHPIEGTLDFSVAADEAAVQPTAAPETTAEAIAPTAEPDVAGTAPDDGAESAEATGLAALPLWLKVAIAVAALGSVVTLITIAVRRTRNERS